MRILVSGDWHGDSSAAKAAARKATLARCSVIVQVGDFGYWPHTDPDYVHYVNKKMLKHDLTLLWIDGNHENFDALYGTDWPKTPEGFWRMDDRVLYAPRALRWEWDGVRFLALGGGHSIDKEWRLSQGPVGLYWWPQETIKQKDVYNCLDGGEVDVMFSHDMPDGAELGIELIKAWPEDHQNRVAVRTVVDAVKPKRLYHGHYHHRNDSLLRIEGAPPVQIVSLGMWQGLPLSSMWTVLDLGELV